MDSQLSTDERALAWTATMARLFIRSTFFPVLFLVNSCAPYGPCSDLELGDRVRIELKNVIRGESCMAAGPLGVGTILEVTVDEEIRGEFCVSTTGAMISTSSGLRFVQLKSDNLEDTSYGDFYGQYSMTPPPSTCSSWIELGIGVPTSKEKSKSTIVGIAAEECGYGMPCKTDFEAIVTRL